MFETTELDFNNLKDSANKSENSKDPTGKSLKIVDFYGIL